MNVIITGATKGIGKATAYKFASEGANLAICARTEGDLESLSDDISSKFPPSRVLKSHFDVADKNEVKSFAEMVLKEWDHIDVLINNAGMFKPGEIHKEEEGVLEEMINTNLYSAYHLSRALIPKFIEQKSGHIFNLCSTASVIAYPNGGAYSISKFALLGMTKNLRKELETYNIKVTAIIPGATFTDSWSDSGIPEDRFMAPEDIASAIWSAYSLSPNANVDEILIRPVTGDV
ncbi:MAG: SDR family oxidoreductase [Bacteroidetes bacterium]|nr:SDR family oxidoreductase [Bacteroidota bacterium]